MRQFFLGMLLIFALTSLGQDIPSFTFKEDKVFYEFVDSSVKAKKEELYSRAKSWVANSFKSAKAVIESDDKESGKLLLKGNGDFFTSLTDKAEFTIEISVKDNKFRIRLFDIETYMTILPSYRELPETIYARYVSNDYPSKTKKEVEEATKKKEWDKNFLLKIDKLVKSIIADAQKAMSENDDF